MEFEYAYIFLPGFFIFEYVAHIRVCVCRCVYA